MTMKRKRGRPQKLTLAQREEVALEYRHRMKARGAAIAMGRDPIRGERNKIFERVRQKVEERFAGHRLPPQDAKAFDAKLKKLGGTGLDSEGNEIEGPGLYDIYRPAPAPIKRAKGNRAKGYRHAIIREIADDKTKEFGKEVTGRMVERCIAEFDFGK
jgi:hypothetical protein